MERNELFQLRLSADEASRLHALAEQAGTNRSDVVRLLIRNARVSHVPVTATRLVPVIEVTAGGVEDEAGEAVVYETATA